MHARFPARSAIGLEVSRSRPILLAFIAVLVGLAIVQAASFQKPGLLGKDIGITDFHAYTVAGQLSAEGRAASAYDWKVMRVEQHRRTGEQSFMPWAYPPQFTFIVDWLSRLPIGVAYLLFILPGLAAFWTVLRSLAGPWLPAALTVAFPALLVNVRCGQNGLYTAAFIGAFLLILRRTRNDGGRNDSGLAGLPLGLMAIKPHLAVAISLLALLERRWKTLAGAAAITLASAALVTPYFGGGIWQAFLAGTQASTRFLAAGLFPLERMTSVYAMLFRSGIQPDIALLCHALIAAGMLGALAMLWRRGVERDWLLAAAAMATIFVSPYNYDYDLPVVAMAAALIWPSLLRRADGKELATIAGLTVLSSCNLLYAFYDPVAYARNPPVSFSPVLLLGAVALCAHILRRPLETAAPHPAREGVAATA